MVGYKMSKIRGNKHHFESHIMRGKVIRWGCVVFSIAVFVFGLTLSHPVSILSCYIQYVAVLLFFLWLNVIFALPRDAARKKRPLEPENLAPPSNLEIPKHYAIGDDGEIVEVPPRKRFRLPRFWK
jgi:hypothetical protein